MRKRCSVHIDDHTNAICLTLAAEDQVRDLDEPFDTLVGPMMIPPFHPNCRTIIEPWLDGMTDDQPTRARNQLRR